MNQSILLQLIAFLWIWPSLVWSHGTSYVPSRIPAPENHTFVREATSLSESEKKWLAKRHQHTTPGIKRFLQSKTNLTYHEIEQAVGGQNRTNQRDINIGLAFSGGGYRAMLTGAGELSALDNRTEGAFEHGLGGLLDGVTYVAGLSGGNWLIGSLAMNNWTSVQDIIGGKSKLWDLEHSIFLPKGKHLLDNTEVFYNITKEVKEKAEAGFDTSLTDVWARALSRDFFPHSEDYGAGLSWSDMRNMPVFNQAKMPFPISVSDGRYPHTKIITLNSTNFEFNPFEMGSWDPTLKAFVDTKYLGTDLVNGKSKDNTAVVGYDNAGFVIGTSSTLFNQFLIQLSKPASQMHSTLKTFAIKLLTKVSNDENDISVIKPNPFYGTKYASLSDDISKSDSLFLVDGGEDSQNVPLSPLIAPERQMDVILAYDNSNNGGNLPNGKAVVLTYQRQFSPVGVKGTFPYVPDNNTFVALNFTTRPVFFGCDARNLTSLGGANGHVPPLVVYTANRPFSFWSNTSTLKMSYTNQEKQLMITNGFEVATRLNLTLDDEWPTCLGCALIRRSQERSNIEQSEQCKKCFQQYCWDGKIAKQPVPSNYIFQTSSEIDNGDTDVKPAAPKKPGVISSFFHKIVNQIAPNGP